MLINLKEAAGLTLKSIRSIKHLIRTNQIGYVIQNGEVLVNEYDLLTMLPSHSWSPDFQAPSELRRCHQRRIFSEIVDTVEVAAEGGYDVVFPEAK